MEVTLEVEDDGFVEAIAALRPIEGDRRDRTVIVDEEILCHWHCSSRPPSLRLVNRSLQ
jgi:hypothetical protein